MSRPMTIAQFAEKIGVTKRTLMRWHEDGKLVPAFVLPSGERRYTEHQLDGLRGKLPEDVRETIVQMHKDFRAAFEAWQKSPRAMERQGYAAWRAVHDKAYDFRQARGPEVAALMDELGFLLEQNVREYHEDPATGNERKTRRKGGRNG